MSVFKPHIKGSLCNKKPTQKTDSSWTTRMQRRTFTLRKHLENPTGMTPIDDEAVKRYSSEYKRQDKENRRKNSLVGKTE